MKLQSCLLRPLLLLALFEFGCGQAPSGMAENQVVSAPTGDVQFRVATPELVQELASVATSDAQLLLERDGGLSGPRGQAARVCLYLFERDQAVGLIRSG